MSIIRYQTPKLTPWSPFDRLTSLRDLLDSAFELESGKFGGSSVWSPPVDVVEDENQVTVHLEAAGMKSEDFDLSLQDGVLSISGERKVEETSSQGETFRSERFFGKFYRTISLPTAVNAEGVSASYTNGVLTVTLPKAEEARPKKITVGVN